MLKIRYFRINLPEKLSDFAKNAPKAEGIFGSLEIIHSTAKEVAGRYEIEKSISIRKYSKTGEEIKEEILTFEIYDFRVFLISGRTFLGIFNPPRNIGILTKMLEKIYEGKNYFLETLELDTAIISRHLKYFHTARLVSAKVRDFEVQPGVVGRLEITSKEGLSEEIAPFLRGKNFKIDSMTYEISQLHKQGLVSYSRNGLLKISTQLEEIVYPVFEECLR